MSLAACKKETQEIVITTDDYHNAVNKLSDVMVHDIFSPPVASRIFSYPNIAAYEIIAQNDPNYNSLVGQVTDLKPIPIADTTKAINIKLAALIANIDLSRRLVFSEDKIIAYRDSLYAIWQKKNSKEFEATKKYGLKVADFIAAWMNKDNYNETRTMPKFTVDSDDPSRWQPTPPSYMDGIEPHWNKIRPFVIDSAAQFKPVRPLPYSLDKNSKFYKELKEVYDIGQDIAKKGDQSEEIAIAQFWDCNPYVSVNQGHMMFAIKKITPGAHWMGICKIVSNKTGADFNKTVFVYTKTSMAIADAFISAWDEKYRSNLIRPETLINTHIDENWKPLLQTPPFPEYVSAHSVISGAAAVVLTDIFGDNFAFDDDTELVYNLPVRHFSSFNQASSEAAISRLYGGIHYRAAAEIGLSQGRNVGKFYVSKLKMAEKK
jgi:hypothetical protein